jgi:hypothetical protein
VLHTWQSCWIKLMLPDMGVLEEAQQSLS